MATLGIASGCTGDTGGGSSGSDGAAPSNVSSCSPGVLFSTSPIALADLNSDQGIIALGNLNPPDHTFPTAHLYFHIRDSDGSQSAPTDNVPLYAPAAMTITTISSSTQVSAGKTDYSITYYPCSQIQGYFLHVASLAGSTQAAFDAATGDCTTYDPGSGSYTRCSRSVNVTVGAGEQIGTAGGPTTSSINLDVGLYDSRVAAHVFANDSRASASSSGFDVFHIVCALDYFDTTLKTQLEARLYRVAGGTPLCGSYDQDVATTAQGKWFGSDAASPATTESGNVALAHNNYDPALGEFSVGNFAIGVGTATFSPHIPGRPTAILVK